MSAKRRGYLRLGLKMANFGPPLHNGGHFHMLNYLPQAIDLFVVYSPWSRYPLEMETREAKWLSIMVQSMSTLVRDLRSAICTGTDRIQTNGDCFSPRVTRNSTDPFSDCPVPPRSRFCPHRETLLSQIQEKGVRVGVKIGAYWPRRGRVSSKQPVDRLLLKDDISKESHNLP